MKLQDVLDFLNSLTKNSEGMWNVPDNLDPKAAAAFVQGKVSELSDGEARWRKSCQSAKTELTELQKQLDGLKELTDTEGGDASKALKSAIDAQRDLQKKVSELEEQIADADKVKGERDGLQKQVTELSKVKGDAEKELDGLKTQYAEASGQLSMLRDDLMVSTISSEGRVNKDLLRLTILPTLKAEAGDKPVILKVETRKIKGEDGSEKDKSVVVASIGDESKDFDDIVAEKFPGLKDFVYTGVHSSNTSSDGQDKKPTPTRGAPGTPPSRKSESAASDIEGAISKVLSSRRLPVQPEKR